MTKTSTSKLDGLFRGRWFAAALVIAVAILGLVSGPGGASAATYVGAALSDVKPEDKAAVANPQPVQLLFQFHTKGAPNAKATKFLKDKVTQTVRDSGLFSEVTETPVPNGAVLSVVIDNVVNPGDMADAQAKGMVTGATFFIAGSNVTDNYVGTVDYVAGPTAPKITRTAHQTVIVQLGLINSAPQNAVKIGGVQDAIFTMARQVVANPLNEIARDPAFQASPPAAAAPTAVVDTPAPAPTSAAPATPASAAPAAQPAPTPDPAAAPKGA